jgi:hypothetical protein
MTKTGITSCDMGRRGDGVAGSCSCQLRYNNVVDAYAFVYGLFT